MEKFKDFLYDKNDVIIAFAILLVAALIIIWRMNVILDYPQTLIDNMDATTQTDDSASTSDDSNAITDDQASGLDSGDSTDANATGDGTDSTDATDSASTSTELWVNGALSRDVNVDVTGNTASAAIQCLIDAGLFTDYAEYQSTCDTLGIDDEKVSGGSFTFKSGSTKSDIAKAVNWG